MRSFISILVLFQSLLFANILSQDGYPRELKWGNKTIELQHKPTKIFVTFVGALDVLQVLVDAKAIVACPKMALDKKYSNCIEFAKKVPFTFSSPDIEMVEKCDPDLIILASFNDPKLIERLSTFRRKVVVLDRFDTYSDILLTIEFLGKLVGEEAKSQNLLTAMKAELKKVEQVKYKTTPLVMTFGFNHYTAGANTIFGEMIELAGAINASARYGMKGHRQIDSETLIKIKPDYFVIFSSEEESKATKSFLEEMRKLPSYHTIPALKRGKIIVIPTSLGTSVSQYFMDGVVLLHKKLLEGIDKD